MTLMAAGGGGRGWLERVMLDANVSWPTAAARDMDDNGTRPLASSFRSITFTFTFIDPASDQR